MLTITSATGSPFTSPKNRAFSRRKVLRVTSTSVAGSCRAHRKAKPLDSQSRSMAWTSPQRWTRNRPSIRELQGADVYIVGGWRYTPFLKWYGSKHITDISKLRGGKIGVREISADGGGLVEFFIEEALKEAGVNPETEVEQVQDPVFGYRNNPAHIEMLRSGKVNAITSSPPFSDQLEKEGYPVILDPNKVFPRRPGKVTVAPRRTIEQRGEELKAYFRAIIRTFWFMRDIKNFEYLHDLEARLRKLTHNEDERSLFIASAPDRVDSWALPMDGGIERQALDRIIQEMVKRGRLERAASRRGSIQRRSGAGCLPGGQQPGEA